MIPEGFITASNKNIIINENALKIASNIFKEILSEEKFVDSKHEDVNNINEKEIGMNSGKLKDVVIQNRIMIDNCKESPTTKSQINTEDTLTSKSDTVYSDLEEKIGFGNVNFKNNNLNLIIPEGFSTASNKSIIVNENALEIASNIFHEILSEKEFIDCKLKDVSNITEEKNSTNINKSEEEVIQNRIMFDNCKEISIINIEDTLISKYNMLCSDSEREICNRNNTNFKNNNLDFMTSKGFITASNKNISVNVNALDVANNIFKEILSENEFIDYKLEDVNNSNKKKIMSTQNKIVLDNCIKSSNKRQIDTKDNVVSKFEVICTDLEKEICNSNNTKFKNNNLDFMASKGFITASNKNISVNVNALDVANNVFKEILSENEFIDCELEEDVNNINKKNTCMDTNKLKDEVIQNRIMIEKCKESPSKKSQIDIENSLIDKFNVACSDSKTEIRNRNNFSNSNVEFVHKNVNISCGVKKNLKTNEHYCTSEVILFEGLDNESDNKINNILSDCCDKVEKNLSINKVEISIINELNLNNEIQDSVNEVSGMTQEISESTNAILYDISHSDSSFNSTCTTHDSTINDEFFKQSISKHHLEVKSPVFDFNKGTEFRKRKRRKCFIQNLNINPLNITYVRSNSSSLTCDIRKQTFSNLNYLCHKKLKDINLSEIILLREKIAINQQDLIDNKPQELCKPRKGLFSLIKQKNYGESLLKAVDSNKPQKFSDKELLNFGLKQSVIDISSENSSNFIFSKDFFSEEFILTTEGNNFGDECLVIPNEDGNVTFNELVRAFLSAPGIDPKLICLSWVRNHYRWIIWKLASMEKSFPQFYGGTYLTLDNVLYQLKFKYDNEIDCCRRSALKCILERDESASKTMILCIASIIQIENSIAEYELELTDGWYSVRTVIDSEMNKLIFSQKVTVGTKLIITNAELFGCSEGCDPLQIDSKVYLKINTNSVRRVRWYARLGFYFATFIPVSDLKSILPSGGIISQLQATIARVYSLLYLEKKSDSFSTLHNEKIENKKLMNFEAEHQLYMESVTSDVMKEIELENLAQVNKEYNSCDQEKLRYLMQDKIKEKLPEKFKKRRNVIPLLKIRLVNCSSSESTDLIFSALLTIWNPSEDLMSLISEGKTLYFYNIGVNGIRNDVLQLSSNRSTKYENSSSNIKIDTIQRRVYAVSEVCVEDFVPLFGEIDIIGVIVRINEVEGKFRKHHQTFYLADLNKNILAVTFRGSIMDSGWEDVLKEKHIVACLNLMWKKGCISWKIPVTYVSDCSSFSHSSSRHKHLHLPLEEYKDYFKNTNINSFVSECNEILDNMLKLRSTITTSTPVKQMGIVKSNNVCSGSSSSFKSFIHEISANEACVPVETDVEAIGLNNKSINSKNILSKLEKLHAYDKPPSLSPISFNTPHRRPVKLSIQTKTFKLRNKLNNMNKTD